MPDDQDGCEWVSFLPIPAYPGCPGPTAVKRCVCVCVSGSSAHNHSTTLVPGRAAAAPGSATPELDSTHMNGLTDSSDGAVHGACVRVCYDKSQVKVKVKFSHTRYRALGPELIPVYRQSARR